MEESPKTTKTEPVVIVREQTVGKQTYIVKSVFIGERDIKDVILEVAARKAARELGLANT